MRAIVERAVGVACGRCRRVVPYHVPGVDLCARCRDVGIEDGWLAFQWVPDVDDPSTGSAVFYDRIAAWKAEIGA